MTGARNGQHRNLTRRKIIASQVIAATIEAGLIKPDESVGRSRKFAHRLQF